SVHGGADLPAKRLVIDGTVFDSLAGNRHTAPYTIRMSYSAGDGSNVVQTDAVEVRNYDGQPGNDFRLYYNEQRPDFLVPRTGSNLRPGVSSWPLIGVPIAGLTNLKAWKTYGQAVAGAIAPPDAL